MEVGVGRWERTGAGDGSVEGVCSGRRSKDEGGVYLV